MEDKESHSIIREVKYSNTEARKLVDSQAEFVGTAGNEEGVIYVNPPLNSGGNINTNTTESPLLKIQTSTSDAQLKADEDFARQLAEEEQLGN